MPNQGKEVENVKKSVVPIKFFNFLLLFGKSDLFGKPGLRSVQLKKWKKPSKFQRAMIKSGFKPQDAQKVWIRMNKWQSVMRKEVRFVMDLKWFRRQGLIFLNDFTFTTLRINFGR